MTKQEMLDFLENLYDDLSDFLGYSDEEGQE
jgi:hypothetical protein